LDFDSLVGDDGDSVFTYDNTNQLTDADYDSDWQDDEDYDYDANGNRTNNDYTTVENNQLTSDGTYNYTYDEEGNRTARFVDEDSSGTLNTGDTDITEYEWDHRNRLAKITFRDTHGGSPTKIVEYAYDFGNRWVRKILDSDGDQTADASTIFVYDGNQITLQFDKTGTGNMVASDLSHRYLWGTAVDQILADEQVTSLQSEGEVLRPLAPTEQALVVGYVSNVDAYIPDKRIVCAGGYEGGEAQKFFLPEPFTEKIESEIKPIVTKALDAVESSP
jgi:hypothetical protein